MPDAAPPISSSDVSERRARSASQMAAFGDQPVTSSQAEDEHPAEDRGVAQTGPIEDLPEMAPVGDSERRARQRGIARA